MARYIYQTYITPFGDITTFNTTPIYGNEVCKYITQAQRTSQDFSGFPTCLGIGPRHVLWWSF